MNYIAHRINTVKELESVPTDCGIELDLRPYGSKIIMSHDPFVKGEEFEELLRSYKHGTMILNIKSENIEEKVLELLTKYEIRKYFFLDSSIPMINLLVKKYNEQNIAVRFSEIEPIELLEQFQSKVKWVWVDCFSRFILTKKLEQRIHKMGFLICLVSPELQGRDSDIEEHIKIICRQGIIVDAVCSKMKNWKRWQSISD